MSKPQPDKKAIIAAWRRDHPDDVGADTKNEIAFCASPWSVLGLDAGFREVVEGLDARGPLPVPVAVKLWPGARTPPNMPFTLAQAAVAKHENVRPSPPVPCAT